MTSVTTVRQVVAKLMKALVQVISWETMGPIAERACVPIVMTEVDTQEDAREICKIIWLQGPAVSSI